MTFDLLSGNTVYGVQGIVTCSNDAVPSAGSIGFTLALSSQKGYTPRVTDFRWVEFTTASKWMYIQDTNTDFP